ncbi:hypothetical protein CAPTEDRAFT_228634 [Capitella teleta]|uniref:protein-histidine N-methyltransferase n=1 Tax=Capitella teleta TaxID=283909 RepID=R7UMF8_CAPTE|nr:hypothetical protein CAPTEDRAFT_228634 [Capitella teleta]|eukprot:ELU05102.1 hypothetical protein CAPTEDRAFT_228634 [Capitella teleta]
MHGCRRGMHSSGEEEKDIEWAEHVAPFKEKSVIWHRIWEQSGRPPDGLLFDLMRQAKRDYKSAVRTVMQNQDNLSNARMADSFTLSCSRDFLAEVKKKSYNDRPSPSVMDGIQGDEEICERFHDKYEELYNCVPYDVGEMDNLRATLSDRVVTRCQNGLCYCDHSLKAYDVNKAIRKLKKGKSGGDLDPSSDHYLNVPRNLHIDDNCENSHDSTEVSEAVTEPKKLKLKADVEAASLVPVGHVTIDWEGMRQGPECSEWDSQAVYVCDGVVIECLKGQTVEEELSAETKNCLCQVLQASSDLKDGVYEGGLKVWECSLDLTEYLAVHGPEFTGLSVLELGCGAGVPGIFSLQQGAKHVCFQDYNREVLEMMTAKNAFLNVPDKCSLSSYYYGDWTEVARIFEEKSRFDDDGYLAAKTCYFGVGGSLRTFEKYLKDDKTFDFKVCHKVEEGVQREILELKFSS